MMPLYECYENIHVEMSAAHYVLKICFPGTLHIVFVVSAETLVANWLQPNTRSESSPT